VLARAPFDATRNSLEDIASLEARLLAMEVDDAVAAAAVVERVLAHDLLVRARRADARGACRRETAVTLTLEDGTLVEGIVDLAFEEDGRWTVVDYKTDREIATAGEEQYRRQLTLYASAIERATGQPATAVLVRI
jgi:ATP-dependent exoDNAse (exonuclease V) beta subunit